MSKYTETLKAAKVIGASRASDPQLMALYCAGPLQNLCGAVAPSLVWEGAQKSGMTSMELNRLVISDPRAVGDLMWIE